MKVIYHKNFLKDIKRIKNKYIALKLKNVLNDFENVNDVLELKNIKKLKGFKSSYRYKLGDYRLGFRIDSNIIICDG